MPAKGNKRIALHWPMICRLLCYAVTVVPLLAQVASTGSRETHTEVSNASELEGGFHLLYELKFTEARTQFGVWQKAHPEDPLGSTSEAASYLFEECYRQGVHSGGVTEWKPRRD